MSQRAVNAAPTASRASGGGPRRSILTLADQVVCSASNFAVGVAVAHIAGIRGLGVFAFGYACWLFLASLHRSLVTDPMAIEGDARSHAVQFRLRTGLSAELVLGLGAFGATLAGGILLHSTAASITGEGLVAVAAWLPFLVVQDYWRWVGFMSGHPGRSLINDIVFAVVQVVAFTAMVTSGIERTTAVVVGCWGLGAVAGSIFGCFQYRVLPTARGGGRLLRSRWHLSRWLVGNDLTLWGTNQGYLLLAGILLGPTQMGGLRAAQALVTGPAFVLLQTGGSIGLPEATKAFALLGSPGLRRVATRMSVAGGLAIGAMAAVVVIIGGPLLGLVYGSPFRHLRVAAALLAIAYAIAAIGLGPTLALKATRRTRRLFRDQLAGLIVSVIAAVLLAHPYGVNGVAVGALIGFSVQIVLLWSSQQSPVTLPSADSRTPMGPRHARSRRYQ